MKLNTSHKSTIPNPTHNNARFIVASWREGGREEERKGGREEEREGPSLYCDVS